MAISFDGPSVPTINGTDGVLMDEPAPNIDSRFSGDKPFTYALSPDSDPLPAGLSVDAATGNIVGTPTAVGTTNNIIVRGSE